MDKPAVNTRKSAEITIKKLVYSPWKTAGSDPHRGRLSISGFGL
jgi:hypothetical protein